MRQGRLFQLCAALVFGVMVSGCTSIVKKHGYMPPADDVLEVKVSVDTRKEVVERLGKPSTQGVLSTSGFYYVRSTFEQFLYNEPTEVKRDVLAITFDAKGKVANVERFRGEDGKVVVLERRVTDSSVKGVGFFKQLFGNFGRIDVAEQFKNQ